MTYLPAFFSWRARSLAIYLVSLGGFFLAANLSFNQALAITKIASPSADPTASISADLTASASAITVSSASATVQEQIQNKKDQDLTETAGKQKSVLAAYLDLHPMKSLAWHNPLQYAIRGSIDRGLPANIIVLLLLFPLVASVIAASRHVVGMTGFGIYIPAVLAVAFVSTGIITGVITFITVLGAAVFTHKMVKRIRMPYLPRTAMLLLGVSVFILLGLMISSYFNMQSLISISIFPLLIMMLLSENFMETQLFNSQKEAIRLTFETLILATACSLFMSWETVQKFVLLWPELTLIGIALVNIGLSRYTGLRLLEHWRFQSIIEKKS